MSYTKPSRTTSILTQNSTTSNNMHPKLHTLPTELLRHILLFADFRTLKAVREACKALQAATEDDSLWRAQVQRRFRVSPRALRSRRLLAAGGVSWRLLYSQWHSSSRMPASRLSGSTHTAFAKGRLNNKGALVWVTVASTDDCRLVGGNLRLRVIVQNISGGEPMRFHLGKGGLKLTDNTTVVLDDRAVMHFSLQNFENDKTSTGRGCTHPGRRDTRRIRRGANERLHNYGPRIPSGSRLADSYIARVGDCITAGTDDNALGPTVAKHRPNCVLRKDDFAVITIDIAVPRALFEVDALERLSSLHIPVSWGTAESVPLVAEFQDRVIWESYERLPGGWWVRADTDPASQW